MTFSNDSIVHSSKVSISLSNKPEKENRGILAVFVSSNILPMINDNLEIAAVNPAVDDSGTMIGTTDQADESFFQIQVSFVRPDTGNSSSTTESNSIVTYQIHLTMEQIASSNLTLPLPDESNSTKLNTDSIALQKLKHLLALLKETTTNESSSQTESTLTSSSSKYFIVIQLIPQLGNDPNVKSTLKISIKERLPNTMVRIVWSSTLLCVDDIENKTNSATELLELSLRLTEQHDEKIQQLRTVQEQYQLLLRDRDGWKDTAQKLDGQWENEKSILFQNFCTLYTSKQDHDQTIITQLKAEIEAMKSQMATNTISLQRPPTNDTKSKPAELPECLQDVPDDHRVEFEDDVVRRLARGERVPVKSNNSKPKKVATTNSKSSTSESTTAAQRKRLRNPISGATEYMDADAALEDILEPTTKVPSKPVTTKKSRTASSKSVVGPSTTKTKKPITAPIKEEESLPIVPITTTTKSTQQSGDDNSDTGSEDEFVDKSIEAQIMADLDALRKL